MAADAARYPLPAPPPPMSRGERERSARLLRENKVVERMLKDATERLREATRAYEERLHGPVGRPPDR